jgi:hypothetical protein
VVHRAAHHGGLYQSARRQVQRNGQGRADADDYLDWTISKPYLVLLALNVAGLVFGVLRLLFWGTEEPATVLMNMGWATFNLIMLGAAVGVAREARQVRVSHRIPMRVPATLLLPDGRTIACKTENYSMGGLGMVLPIDVPLVEGARWAYVCRAAREPITSPPWSRAISIATLGCAWTI